MLYTRVGYIWPISAIYVPPLVEHGVGDLDLDHTTSIFSVESPMVVTDDGKNCRLLRTGLVSGRYFGVSRMRVISYDRD